MKAISKTFFICLIMTLGGVSPSWSQTTYNIDINLPEKEILRGHLDLGGKNPQGDSIGVNSYYIERNDTPFFPVIGEFHFSRYPEEYWEESILKMKAGGINTIASYVFWNLHEHREGSFDWSGNLNLNKFLQLIQKHGVYAIVRLGPFCHGEMRNGGMPDWLYGRSFEIRSNDPEYLKYVDRLYSQIAAQMKGLLYGDGGPVIGVQLENEYQHSAAPWEYGFPGANRELTVADRDAALAHEQIAVTDGKNPWSEYGKRHMENLKSIAKKNGIVVPLYTATGWGNATIVEKGSLPVTAGYAYPFWAKPNPSPFYLFKDIHKNPDYSPVSFDTNLYPSIPAEIGPGIQVKHTRRPFVPYQSVNPLMVRIVGSGSNGIGYYMYHGGSTPVIDGKFYNEEANGIPRINYDFQAPIGQYGQTRYHFKHLRTLHMFLDAYGQLLAPMKTVLPETNAGIKATNTETLRYAVRSYGNSGFVFLVNFQDYVEIKDIKSVKIGVKTRSEEIAFPSGGFFDVPKATSAIFPFNLPLGKAMLQSATVQPLTILKPTAGNHYIFMAIDGIEPEMVFPLATTISQLKNATQTRQGSLKRVTAAANKPFSFTANGERFLVLPQQMALNASKVEEHLVVSDALLLYDGKQLQCISRVTDNLIQVYPKTAKLPIVSMAAIQVEKSVFEGFSTYRLTFNEVKPVLNIEKVSNRKYTLELASDVSMLNDVFVEASYVGDRAMAFIGGEMMTDHLFHDRPWEIGLRHFVPKLKGEKMVLVFHPIYSTYGYLGDLKSLPDLEKGSYLKVDGFKVIPEYKAFLKFDW